MKKFVSAQKFPSSQTPPSPFGNNSFKTNFDVILVLFFGITKDLGIRKIPPPLGETQAEILVAEKC